MPTDIGRRTSCPRRSSRLSVRSRPAARALPRTARDRPSIWITRKRRQSAGGAEPARSRRINRSTARWSQRKTSSRVIGVSAYPFYLADLRWLCYAGLPMLPAAAERPIVAVVRRFVEKEVRPVAATLEHADRYPHDLVTRMKELGLFGSLIPREYGGLGLDCTTYAMVIEELCPGGMALAGGGKKHTN